MVTLTFKQQNSHEWLLIGKNNNVITVIHAASLEIAKSKLSVFMSSFEFPYNIDIQER